MQATAIKLPAVCIPDSVPAILSTTHNPPCGSRPVHTQNEAIMASPLDRFGIRSQWLDCQCCS